MGSKVKKTVIALAVAAIVSIPFVGPAMADNVSTTSNTVTVTQSPTGISIINWFHFNP